MLHLRGCLEEQREDLREQAGRHHRFQPREHPACFIEPTDTKDGHTRVNVRVPIVVGVPRSAALNYYIRVISSTADILATMFHDGSAAAPLHDSNATPRRAGLGLHVEQRHAIKVL